MKRIDLVRHLETHGCRLLREGANHSVYLNEAAGKISTIPRYREIKDFLARKICKDLDSRGGQGICRLSEVFVSGAAGGGVTVREP